MILDAALVAVAGVGTGWAAARWEDTARAERWGTLLLFSGVGLNGAVGLVGVGLPGRAVGVALLLAGFYLLVVRSGGVPRAAPTGDPADRPDDEG